MFERQLPVMFGPLKVSPKAICTVSLTPFNHMVPTSVP